MNIRTNVLLPLLFFAPSLLPAADDVTAKLAALDTAVKTAQSAGDNA